MMGPKQFKEMMNQIPRLTPVQTRRLMLGIQKSVKSDELPEQVRQRAAALDYLRVCTHCGASGVARHGKSAGLCRFRCRSASCGRSHHALTGTALGRLRRKSKWLMFEGDLRDRLTSHQSAERYGISISYRTAFLWRHRFLEKEQKGSNLKGIVEMDETYFLESCKGDRSFLRERRLPRKRGGNRGHGGMASEQRSVPTAVSRGGPIYAEALSSTAGAAIAPMMLDGLAEDYVYVTDGHSIYQVASQRLNIHQEVVRVSRRKFRRGRVGISTPSTSVI